jgi:peptidoglycan hydrolase CwlO-like protein
MTLLFIQLTQTVTGAVITIIALLLVAVIIGYFTAWYYAKSVYTPIIKGLEADKAEMNKQIEGLKDDIVKLTAKVEKQSDKISRLEEELDQKGKEIKKLSKPKK